MNQVGRPPRPVIYKDVYYDGKEYVVGIVQYKEGTQPFVIDKEDYDKISEFRSWRVTANSYIGSYLPVNGERRTVYLHNIIMGKLTFDGKGQTSTVDHINRIGFDNRKANLRIYTQTEQNLNQRQKPRKVVLPADSGLTANDIPKHIWYIKPNGGHGDRFAIELKSEGIIWKSTSSKSVSLRDKLSQCKEKLEELYELYPHINPEYRGDLRDSLSESFDEIVRLATI
jgi:hypothetical protein